MEIVSPKIKPLLDLSLDNIHVETNKNEDELLEENIALFETLNQDKSESGITVSGKLLTDENKDENYLKTVDGAQINIQGNFE